MRKIYCLFTVMLWVLVLQAQSNAIVAEEAKYAVQQTKRIAELALSETPNPIQTISTEGKLKGDPVKTATQLAIRDFIKIYSLAFCYKTNKEQKYLAKATEYLLAWANVNQPAGNPINDTNYDPAIDAYVLIKSAISIHDNQIISAWLHTIATTEIGTMPKNQQRETAYNNWNSHRLKIVGEIGFAVGDTSLQQFAIVNLKKQLAVNLLPDGSGIDFKLRDALHYHVYDLEPLLRLAIVIKANGGPNFFTYQSATGSSIKKSVEWLVPYLNGEKTHEEFVHSTVTFDQKRAQNGEAGYQKGTLFDPMNGLKTLAEAGYFDPSYDQLYQKVKGTAKTDADWQMLYRLFLSKGTI